MRFFFFFFAVALLKWFGPVLPHPDCTPFLSSGSRCSQPGRQDSASALSRELAAMILKACDDLSPNPNIMHHLDRITMPPRRPASLHKPFAAARSPQALDGWPGPRLPSPSRTPGRGPFAICGRAGGGRNAGGGAVGPPSRAREIYSLCIFAGSRYGCRNGWGSSRKASGGASRPAGLVWWCAPVSPLIRPAGNKLPR